MSTVIGLDQIRAETHRSIQDLTVGLAGGKAVCLRNALRLSKKDRDALKSLGERIAAVAEAGDDEDELVAALADVVLLVAESKPTGRALLSEIGGDLLTLTGLFRKYQEVCQLPEASGSTS
ncbi:MULTISPECIES: phage tail assembly protein [Actinokineospora]|uniref:Tail assembly chaperone n=1 Tax=Actinokineospora cianjurensis TaxID=585224 RepID=A0A421AY80_9PSEU|nr:MULTISPECIES: phage tail assembly protein [Actinokineospora]MBM7771239.1 hypothetical protein [Actinokineospora baliensis]RLK54822.1 hypothetical protein CLV68_5210 [Actinokineospora cianjurensis]